MASGTSLVPNRNGSRGSARHDAPPLHRLNNNQGIPLFPPAPPPAFSLGLFRFSTHSTFGYLENFPDVYRFRIRRNILIRRTAAATPGQQGAASSRRGSLDDQGNSG
ncbi:hypothetical protein CFB45_27415 [Burkholderia sp. HI2500]|nr:hypothetical protein CFB45_27415 [Burkholderia sp. HI2500]